LQKFGCAHCTRKQSTAVVRMGDTTDSREAGACTVHRLQHVFHGIWLRERPWIVGELLRPRFTPTFFFRKVKAPQPLR
jgi:hypothetical protein